MKNILILLLAILFTAKMVLGNPGLTSLPGSAIPQHIHSIKNKFEVKNEVQNSINHNHRSQQNANAGRSTTIKLRGTRTDYYQTAGYWLFADSSLYQYNNMAYQTSEADFYFDSTWENNWRNLYTYDNHGNQTGEFDQEWITPVDTFASYQQTVNTYDAQNNKTGQRKLYWIPYLNNFRNYEYYGYTYDIHNNVTSNLYQVWDTAVNSFINSSREDMTYDAHNNLLVDLFLDWNGTSWDSSSRNIMTYDSHNNKISYTHQDFNGSGWNDYDQSLWQYNAANFDTLQMDLFYGVNSWVPYRQYLSERDSNNNITAYIWQSYNTADSTWSSFYQTLYYYINNLQIASVQQQWDGTNMVWTNNTQDTHEYDIHGNDTLHTSYTWNSLLVYWQYDQQHAYQYNTDNLVSYHLFRETQSGVPLDTVQQTFYYYQTLNVATGVAEKENELKAQLFPNPFSADNLSMKIELANSTSLNIQVFDMQGRMVSGAIRPASGGTNIINLDLSGLSNGHYLVQIAEGNTGKTTVLKAIKN